MNTLHGPGLRPGLRPGLQIVLAGALAMLASIAVAAPRLLIEAEDAQVHMTSELRCDKDAQLSVLARDPALFGGDSARLQSLLDATHALLGFACRNLPGMVVNGRLEGIESLSYEAVAGPRGDWRLQPSRTMQVSSLAGGTPAAWSTPQPTRASAPASDGDFVVRNLRRGMPIQDATAALRAGFASEPTYDVDQHLLSVVDGACAIAGKSPRHASALRAGDVCLQATFTDDRSERLDRLSFAQVVDKNQSAAIRDELEQRYGRPAQDSTPRPSTTALGWGRRLPGADRRYEMEALIEVRDTTTVLVLQLQGAEEAARYKIDF